MTDVPGTADLARIERALAWRPNAFRRAGEGRGAAATAARWIVGDGRRSAFVKIGATELTAEWTRDEHRNYGSISGWFMPRMLGFDDDGDRPVLAIEDLSAAIWPPPWTAGRIEAVLDALAAIRGTVPPAHLHDRTVDWGSNWADIAAHPAPFLSLGLCSREWLDRHVAKLAAASADAPLTGDSLVHLDIRSDNLCFRDGKAVILDWNHAMVANGELEIAGWLPSLHAEGGPPPETILPSSPKLAAFISGFFCSRAGGSPLPEAPHVRPLQIAQARTALPWAARAIGIPAPD